MRIILEPGSQKYQRDGKTTTEHFAKGWSTLSFEPLLGLAWTHGRQKAGLWQFWPVDAEVEELPN
jgi:hypothetical protein